MDYQQNRWIWSTVVIGLPPHRFKYLNIITLKSSRVSVLIPLWESGRTSPIFRWTVDFVAWTTVRRPFSLMDWTVQMMYFGLVRPLFRTLLATFPPCFFLKKGGCTREWTPCYIRALGGKIYRDPLYGSRLCRTLRFIASDIPTKKPTER